MTKPKKRTETDIRREITGIRDITTGEAIGTAINLYQAALRHYKVDEIAELTPRKRKNLIESVNVCMRALGIEHIAVDWWEARKA